MHIREWSDGGSDHPMNGLVMCALHHRAYDNDLFAFQPGDMSLQYRNGGPDQGVLRIQVRNIQHLRKYPHAAALEWRWQHWSGKDGDSSAATEPPD